MMLLQPPIDPRDPRVYLAAERTLLAWVRTSLALMGLGFVVARFGIFLRELAILRDAHISTQMTFSAIVGTVMILIGATMLLLAAARHWRSLGRIERGEPLRLARLSGAIIVAIVLAILGVGLAVYLVLTQ